MKSISFSYLVELDNIRVHKKNDTQYTRVRFHDINNNTNKYWLIKAEAMLYYNFWHLNSRMINLVCFNLIRETYIPLSKTSKMMEKNFQFGFDFL